MASHLTLELKLLDNLKQFKERILEEREQRLNIGRNNLSFGMKFLDEALGGIYSNDLIIYAAKTGIGKTQLAVITALASAALGKRVHFFALEAEVNEIERRIKYQILAEQFFKHHRNAFPNIHLNFMDWYYGKLEASLGQVETELELMIKDLYPGLWTFYREGDFTVEQFEQKFMAIKDQTDLVIVDHLHFFDHEDENENRAMKRIVKSIRDLANVHGKPVILVAHMRKSERRSKQVIPGLEEIHGSSDITKIGTKVVTLAPCYDAKESGNIWPTYVRAAKCRPDNSRTRFVALMGFDSNLQHYENKYYLGKLSGCEEEFEPIHSFNNLPYWAKSADVLPLSKC